MSQFINYMKKLSNIIIFIIILIIFDFILTFFFISKFNFYENFYPKQDHRIANKNYHHSFKEEVDTFDYWGSYKYKFFTNSLGFKDKSNRKINKETNHKRRIIIIGDSFTEGIGFKYEDTFLGLLDNQMINQNIEILNAGVASQSPIIYFKKIKHLIQVKKIKFNELIVFLDISDIPDEFYYNINFDSNDIKKFSLRNYLQEFLLQSTSTYLFFDIIFTKINILKENLILRFKASEEFNISFLNTNIEHMNLFKSINAERGNWTSDINLWKLYGKKGRELADFYLNNLLELCDDNKIRFTLVIYPWPNQIYYGYESILHRDFWSNWSETKNINFIDLFEFFENDNPENIIKSLFVDGDIHWNKKGHHYVYEIMMSKYFGDP